MWRCTSGKPSKHQVHPRVWHEPELQRWEHDAHTRQLLIGHGLCLEAPKPMDAGSGLVLSKCHSTKDSQRWMYYASGQLVNFEGGLCLDTAHPDVDGGDVHLWACDEHSEHQNWILASESAKPGHAPPSNVFIPVNEFYMYRAAGEGWLHKYPFGNMNLANMDGVIWYLMNEVVTEYTTRPACPRKFDISVIHRFKVKTRATPKLFEQGMNFGARFAYDQGICMGRCFPGNNCTCEQDCTSHYDELGFVPGCNNFYDNYPFPAGWTPAPSGIWYSLPLEGRCSNPTGHDRCTWSYEDAGSITLKELEAISPGGDNCCHGSCTSFWHDQFDVNTTYWRVDEAKNLFARKHPEWPRDLGAARCDFDRTKWYSQDTWTRQDPWETEHCFKWPASII